MAASRESPGARRNRWRAPPRWSGGALRWRSDPADHVDATVSIRLTNRPDRADGLCDLVGADGAGVAPDHDAVLDAGERRPGRLGRERARGGRDPDRSAEARARARKAG